MTERNSNGRIGRRTYLKAGAALAGGALLSGAAGATRNDDSTEYHVGDATSVGDGTVEAYATTDSSGAVSSLGVHIDGKAFAAVDEGGPVHEEPVAAHLHFPTETEEGDAIDPCPFTFNGFHYNPQGHAPPGIYTVPHFDFHFYTMAEEDVDGISGGPLADAPVPIVGIADYEVPETQRPPGYMFEEHRFVVEGMGEHLLDRTAPEFQGDDFSHTYVYGVYDSAIDPEEPDGSQVVELQGEELELPVYQGDGEGNNHLVEPMVTTDFIRDELDGQRRVGVATPARFPEAAEYPTTYAMEPDGDGGVYVSVGDFWAFPGPEE
jgi:hypothetical protein